MNNVTILKALTDALSGLTPEQQEGLQAVNNLNPLESASTALQYEKQSCLLSCNTGYILGDLIRALKLEIAQTENKNKNGNAAKQHKVLLSVIKAAIKRNAVDGIQGYWIFNGKQTVCDGYRAFLMNNVDETLPKIPEGVTPFDLTNALQCKNKNHIVLEKPNTALLKAYIKTHKNPVYHFGNVIVKAEYLLDVLEAMPDCTMYMESYLSPIYCADDNGNEALLLPIRPNVKGKTDPLGDEYKTIL